MKQPQTDDVALETQYALSFAILIALDHARARIVAQHHGTDGRDRG
jgi:hypothetical protein